MQNLYKRRFPKRNFHQQVTDVLRMSQSQFVQVQGAAQQFLGERVLHPNLKRPKNKLLPSSLRTIRDMDHPGTLAALMHLERIAHNDPEKDYHSGGGLAETTTSLLSSIWNTVGLGPEFNSWFGFYDYDSPENKISKDDKEYAEIVQQSYKDQDERTNEIGDWVRDSSIGNDKFSVWVDREDDRVHVALRGTKANMDDLGSDMNILMNNKSGNEQEIYEYLEQVQEKYPDSMLDASGHSLGANQLIEVFEKHKDLDYDRVNLFSPGTNPMWGLDDSKDAVKDDKYYFYLNSGDLVSNTFVSLIPSEREHVYWAKPGHNPVSNHGIAQWIDTI